MELDSIHLFDTDLYILLHNPLLFDFESSIWVYFCRFNISKFLLCSFSWISLLYIIWFGFNFLLVFSILFKYLYEILALSLFIYTIFATLDLAFWYLICNFNDKTSIIVLGASKPIPNALFLISKTFLGNLKLNFNFLRITYLIL